MDFLTFCYPAQLIFGHRENQLNQIKLLAQQYINIKIKNSKTKFPELKVIITWFCQNFKYYSTNIQKKYPSSSPLLFDIYRCMYCKIKWYGKICFYLVIKFGCNDLKSPFCWLLCQELLIRVSPRCREHGEGGLDSTHRGSMRAPKKREKILLTFVPWCIGWKMLFCCLS